MTKHSKQMRILATRPSAMMRFQATGRLPQVEQPQSPLIHLLERIGPRARQCIEGVTLGPSLGYNTTQTFPNAEALYMWLKPHQWVEPRRDMASRFKLAHFNKRLELSDLLDAARSYPQSLACEGIRQDRPRDPGDPSP